MIVPMARIDCVSHPDQLDISADDVARGYVEMSHASHLEMRSNARCRLRFRPAGDWFDFVHVEGLPRALTFGPEGGAFVRPLELQRRSTYELSYRFELNDQAVPGRYAWPVAVSLAAD